MASRRTRREILFTLLATLLAVLIGFETGRNQAAEPGRTAADAALLRIVVMDPLSDRLACDCVAGYAQRKYGVLGEFLEKELQHPVEIAYAESLAAPQVRIAQGVDLIFGKYSEVVFDAAEASLRIRPIAMLSGMDGSLTQTGLFVVRQADAARSIEDLKNRRILFGPEEADEKRAAALASLEAFALPIPKEIPTSPSCNSAALAVVEEEADAAVISIYAMPLLEGCGAIDKGSLKIIGRTDPVPFIGVFATDRVEPELGQDVHKALMKVGDRPDLLASMESKKGFIGLTAAEKSDAESATGWPDWRGPRRDAITDRVPKKLPAEKRLLWSRTLTGPGMSGLAVDSGYVIAADKDFSQTDDIFRCLDADTGREIWKLSYPAPGEMDFTNSPRANPVIHEGLVYLLGAFGHLHCVKLDSGQIVWKKNLIRDFGAELPTWGMASTPLLVDDKLIVNPGAEDAAVVALDRLTGDVLWSTPGDPPGYASFILALPSEGYRDAPPNGQGGRRQIVGYDAVSLGGWDPETGRRLWQLVPPWDGDYNVPTPIAVGGRLLVSTENNGTRLYEFDASGRIIPQPVAENEDLAPDTSTPVVLDGVVLGSCFGLVCLDLKDGLKTLWQFDEDPYADYCSFIAGDGHVLVTTQMGTVSLVKATGEGFACVGSLDLFDDVPATERDVWSHPALVNGRLYIRNLLAVYCFLIE